MSLLPSVNYVGGREDGCGAFGSLWSMDFFSAPPYVRRFRYWASKAVTDDRSGYGRERVGVAPVAV